MVKLFPEQIEPLFTETKGEVITVTLEIAVLKELQPAVLVPVTEYDVLINGFTIALPPLILYELAPLGVKVKFFPEQIDPLLTETVGVIKTITDDTTVLVAKHPAALVPVTV